MAHLRCRSEPRSDECCLPDVAVNLIDKYGEESFVQRRTTSKQAKAALYSPSTIYIENLLELPCGLVFDICNLGTVVLWQSLMEYSPGTVVTIPWGDMLSPSHS